MHEFLVIFLLLAGAAPSSRLAEAKRLLARGQLDEVLFTLEGESAPAEREDAAHVLAEAARQAHEKRDSVLALHFVQLSLRRMSDNPLALEVGARASLGTQQFESAERYADGWITSVSQRPEPYLLRAEIALAQGEWERAIERTQSIEPDRLSSSDRSRLETLWKTAQRELQERAEGRAQAEAMRRQLQEQMERSTRTPRASPVAARAAHRKGEIILYSTAWCGYCKKAAAWLKRKGVSFIEKDIEKDEAAAAELSEKKRKAGRRGSGVPWIDVGGQLVSGFDVPELERLIF